MWRAHEGLPGSGTMFTALRVRRGVTVVEVAQGVDRVLREHPILRSALVPFEGGVALQESREVPSAVTALDVAGWGRTEIEARLSHELSRPFELESPPLFRVILMRRSADESFLGIAAHHGIIDGASMGILWREMFSPEPVRFVARDADFFDYLEETRAARESNATRSARRYWHRCLGDGVPTLRLRSRVPGSHRMAALSSVRIEAAQVERVTAHARTHRATLHTAVLAAYRAALGIVTGQADFAIGCPVDLRSKPRFKRVCGPIYDYLPMRIRTGPDPAADEVLHETCRQVREAFTNVAYPFSAIQAALAGPSEEETAPIFQAMLNFYPPFGPLVPFILPDPGGRLQCGQTLIESMVLDTALVPFERQDMTLLAAVEEGGLVLKATYKPSAVDASSATAVLELTHRLLLRQGLGEEGARVSQLARAE